jgi:inorganic pyrophosphatase
MEILCVEDGSVDLDALEQDGLKDGMVLPYRQGSKPPFVLELDIDDYSKLDKRVLEEKMSHFALKYDNLKNFTTSIVEQWQNKTLKDKEALEKLKDYLGV